MTDLQARLFALRDMDYRRFQARLIPLNPPGRLIGVRTPALRALLRDGLPSGFLTDLPHAYFEEDQLHALFLAGRRDALPDILQALDAFLPFVDNWATCDTAPPAAFKAHTAELLAAAQRWRTAQNPFAVRFALVCLLKYALNGDDAKAAIELAVGIRSDAFYVQMAQAWFFCEALIRSYDRALPVLTDNLLPATVHNRAIQKAVDSFRLTAGQKLALKALRRQPDGYAQGVRPDAPVGASPGFNADGLADL